MLVQIEFISNGSCSAAGVGNFNSGDTARVNEALAKHLVEEARCAVYGRAERPSAASPKVETKPVRVTKKKVEKA